MADIELVIKIPEEDYIKISNSNPSYADDFPIYYAIKNGVKLPKGHGRLIDLSKLDDDRIESDNPIIYLTINGAYIEAVSLDYLDSLPTVVKADAGE